VNGTTNPDDTVVAQLCPACGLCCNGVIFANLALRPADDINRLGSLGLPVADSRSALRPPHLPQPCPAFDGRHCRIYSDRPQYCREFECVLLQSVKARHTNRTAALGIIRTARDRADKVRGLLRTLGDTGEQVPLSHRFRRMTKRLEGQKLNDDTAETYADLTLAVHDLNLLLSEAFYPGTARRSPKSSGAVLGTALLSAALALFAAANPLLADQVELQNGDRYVGHILSLNSNTVVLQSEVLGTLRLPRSKVAVITLGAQALTNSPALPSATNLPVGPNTPASTKSAATLSPTLRQLGTSTNLIQQIQKRFLGDAGPEANNKFNELLGGLLSGKLTVDDIRAEAKTAADQLRALQRESGEDAGFAASAYLAILDRFLKESTPAGTATNVPAPSPKARAEPAPEKE
jgi:uncharacterized protein